MSIPDKNKEKVYINDKYQYTIPSYAREDWTSKGNIVTGSKDSLFLRNKYQGLIEGTYQDIRRHIDFLQGCNRKAQGAFDAAESLTSNIKAHEDERASLYKTLDDFLEKEVGHEYKMWKESPQGLRINTKEGLKTATNQLGLGTFQSGGVLLKYLERYPQLSSNQRFQEISGKISGKEKAIRECREALNEQIKRYNHELSYFPKNIKIADDLINKYTFLLRDGTKKLEACRYTKSVLFKLRSEGNKSKHRLQVEHHQLGVEKNVLDSFRNKYGESTDRVKKLEYT